MAEDEVVVKKATEEPGIVLKRRQRSPSMESPNPASSFETPQPSSASTPRSSVPSSVRSTPAREKPSKYVSKMARTREEKKRQESVAAAPLSDKSTTSSDTSSLPSTESSILSDKSHAPADKLGMLPKFGEWNAHTANSGPCYTLLFQKAAQDRKIGGPIRVHGPNPTDAPAVNQDLYGYNRMAPVKKPRKKTKKSYGLFCCFKASESS